MSRSARGKAEKAARVTNDRLELREHLKRYPPGTPIRRKSERQLVLGRRRWIPKQFVRVKVRMRAAGPAHCRSRLVGAAKLFRSELTVVSAAILYARIWGGGLFAKYMRRMARETHLSV